MSPKSKRQRQPEESLVLARESKMRCCSNQEESIMEGQFSGMTDYIAKPINQIIKCMHI